MIDSNELTRKIKTPLNPRAALIAYASEGDKNFFLEIRGIDDRGNMTEGRTVRHTVRYPVWERSPCRHRFSFRALRPRRLLPAGNIPRFLF